jgi:hypothetical protein
LKAYFVRKTADEEVVGLFVASSTMVLVALVDEHCDPRYANMPLPPPAG